MTMTNSENRYISEILYKFQEAKGRACVFLPKQFPIIRIVANAIAKFRYKRPDDQILIIVSNQSERIAILTFLQQNNIYYNIKILTREFVKSIYSTKFVIFINILDYGFISNFADNGKFVFSIYNVSNIDTYTVMKIREILCNININIDFNNIVNDKLSLPVEEHRIGIQLEDNDTEVYTKCEQYIKDCMAIFGDLSNVNKCRIGDVNNGISAAQFRQDLAIRNGWSSTLDTSVPIYKEIDDIYNPNALFEKANLVYNIIRERINIVTNCQNKLENIKNIILDNIDKKILIVSKSGEFANKIFNYINDEGFSSCGAYHSDVEPSYMNDENGNIICYKTGKDKGKYKLFGAIALSNAYLEAFNNGQVNCLSIKNSSSEKLKTSIDIVIFTSSLYADYDEFIKRFTKISITNPVKIYKLYCHNTIESKEIEKQVPKPNVKIIENELNIEIDNENFENVL